MPCLLTYFSYYSNPFSSLSQLILENGEWIKLAFTIISRISTIVNKTAGIPQICKNCILSRFKFIDLMLASTTYMAREFFLIPSCSRFITNKVIVCCSGWYQRWPWSERNIYLALNAIGNVKMCVEFLPAVDNKLVQYDCKYVWGGM